jgi:hypothetical protein
MIGGCKIKWYGVISPGWKENGKIQTDFCYPAQSVVRVDTVMPRKISYG